MTLKKSALRTLIGKGAQADIYLYEGKALKVYHSGSLFDEARYEARLLQLAHDTGLPVPKVHRILEIEDGSPAILMDYVKGETLGALADQAPAEPDRYLADLVALQMRIHAVSGDGFPDLRERIAEQLDRAERLSAGQKERLLGLLGSLETGESLCHFDFHPYNILRSGSDDANRDDGTSRDNGANCDDGTSRDVIIDWVNALRGSLYADVCRTYLLHLLHSAEQAERYLRAYCAAANISPERVLAWLPVLAGARMTEHVPPEHETLLLGLIEA